MHVIKWFQFEFSLSKMKSRNNFRCTLWDISVESSWLVAFRHPFPLICSSSYDVMCFYNELRPLMSFVLAFWVCMLLAAPFFVGDIEIKNDQFTERERKSIHCS